MTRILLWIALIGLSTTGVAQSKLDQARAMAEAGNFKEAIVLIDEVIVSNPPRSSYYQQKAGFQLAQQDYEGVMQTLTKAITLMPDSADLYDSRGTLLEAFRLYKEAIEDFTKAYNLTRTDDKEMRAHLLMNRGGTKARIRDFEGAYADLMLASELDPKNIDVLNNLAMVCSHVGKQADSFKYLEKVISVNPNYAIGYVNLGFSYQGLDQHKKAIEYFDKAISLDPTEPLAFSNRSFSKLKTGDLEGAMNDINQSLKMMPSNSYAYKIRALILFEKKMNSDACKDLNEAVELGYEQQYGSEVNELLAKKCKN